MSRVDQSLPTKYEHLELVLDEETGYLKIICPHYAWEQGAPFVVKGPGKLNPDLWPSEVKFLEYASGIKHTENPNRTLRCGKLSPYLYRGVGVACNPHFFCCLLSFFLSFFLSLST
jgi:hypothetical protein